jgi:ATP/maltotriose-dependent transcriptional regulator MalT
VSTPTLADCIRSGAAVNALRCSSCPELSMVAVHHCERIVVAIGVRCGGLSRVDVAELLGISEETVKTHEENAKRKIGRRLPIALEAA